MEDDPETRAALREALNVLNYQVLVAADGQDALATIQQRGGDVALVLTGTALKSR